MAGNFKKYFTPPFILGAILIFAFFVRIIGIHYGLPLWLVDDEPPFTLGALKMIQLKTLIPAHHLADFQAVLYYPPYLSYLYLAPFSLFLGIRFLSFHGGLNAFLSFITADLSPFFLIARLINIGLSLISVWLIYETVKNIFPKKAIALLSAFFLGTSVFYLLMSVNGRHWLPVSFLLTLVLFFLSKLNWSWQKRYCWAILISGIGVGVSTICTTFLFLILGWYLFFERRSLKKLFLEKSIYFSGIAFIFLALLPSWLYPNSFGFKADLTGGMAKSLLGIIASPFLFLKPAAVSEPILVIFAVAGLIFSFVLARNLFWPIAGFIYAYSVIFYLLFRYEHRFILPLFPLLAILAGYGFFQFLQKFKNKAALAVGMIILILPAIFSLKLSLLIRQDDSRLLAREWAERNLPQGSKILVYARLTRLASVSAAIREQEGLDSGSLRKVDLAEASLDPNRPGSFYALNLYSVNNIPFFKNLKDYAQKNNYRYVLMEMDAFRYDPSQWGEVWQTAEDGSLLAAFGYPQNDISLSTGQILVSPAELLKLNKLGPEIRIYKI